MMKSLPIILLTFLISLSSCVTINIYFPAAAAEAAADQIIQDIWGEQTMPPSKTPPNVPIENNPTESEDINNSSKLYQLLDFIIPSSHAAANININTPKINTLKSKMQTRHQSLLPYYNSGAIGLTKDGLITLKSANLVPLNKRNTVKKLILQENKDRNQLYKEIAIANGHPEWEEEIRSTFARRWISNAQKGWWYQDNNGNWKQK